MSASTKKTPSSNVKRWPVPAVCLVLAAMTFAVFGQTLRHEFIDYDDDEYVYGNPVVAQGLTRQGIVWAFSCHAFNWHPLTWFSHMLDCQLYGLQPGGHHLTNVLLHTATVIALFLVLRQMTGTLWRSAFVAAVFAIHPLRVESVAWVAERKDVLSGLFFMLTIGAYVRYARQPWSWGCYGLVLLLFAMGLMSKPMLVTLPVVLLLLDYWPLQRKESAGKLVLEKLPLLALSAASCVATLLAQGSVLQSTELFSLPLRFGNALLTCLVYLRQMIWPEGLALFYPFPHNGPPPWEVALAGLLLAGFSALAFWQRRKQPWILVGWLWYLVMLLPVAGIVQVGRQAHADRYTYLPQIGIYVAVTWLVAGWAGKRLAAGLMTGVIVVLIFCAWQQTAYWQNTETVWTHTLACTTDNYVAQCNLGNDLRGKGKLDAAIIHYQEALAISPNYAPAHYNLGNALYDTGRLDEAIVHYQEALQIQPDSEESHYNLGLALLRKGSVDEAIRHFQQALQISPGLAETHYNLGLAFARKGSVGEAIAHFQKALQISPANPTIQNSLAWLLATGPEASLRNGSEAVALAQEANALTGGKDPAILGTLAAALAEAGRFGEARESAQKAIELAQAAGQQDLAAKLGRELQRYQARLPLHP